MRTQRLEFRKEDIGWVMRRWQAGDSAILIGIGSIGKTNLIHHLADARVIDAYLGRTDTARILPVIIDPNLLGALPDGGESRDSFRAWAGYEIIMHRLYMALYPLDALGEDAVAFYEAYQALQDGSNPLYSYMGLRYLELGLEIVYRHNLRIVLMFDEFEALLQQLPLRFFLALRGLRDRHKSELCFLAFSRAPMPLLIERFELDALTLEPFTELFTDNARYVGPYSEADAREMVARLNARREEGELPIHVLDFLLYVSGRFAGLLRASYRQIDLIGDFSPNDTRNEALIARLASRPPILAECATIWQSLTAAEQQVLMTVGRLAAIREIDRSLQLAVEMLVNKRLLVVDASQQRLLIEPPLFRHYVTAHLGDLKGCVVLGEANDYQRPAAGVQHELRVSNSRFITSISLAESVDDARQYIGAMRKTFRDANHHVYAFIVGYGASVTEGMSDDGEPSGTAGPPTLAVLRGAAIGDVVLVTTRYFGGTKLGTGGLVRAYTDAAKAGLALLKTERRTTSVILELAVPYALLERVRRLNSAYGAEVLEEHFAENVTVHIRLDEDRWPAFTAAVMEASAGQVQPVRFAQQSD